MQDRAAWFRAKMRWLRHFAFAALAGVPLVAVGAWQHRPVLAAVGALPLVPLVAWLVVIPILHWKDRYVGGHSDLWGGLLVLETSGWSKIVYWFRHVNPDRRREGRYADVA
jgi:hypothetical protein